MLKLSIAHLTILTFLVIFIELLQLFVLILFSKRNSVLNQGAAIELGIGPTIFTLLINRLYFKINILPVIYCNVSFKRQLFKKERLFLQIL